jgi:hypothetical protein
VARTEIAEGEGEVEWGGDAQVKAAMRVAALGFLHDRGGSQHEAVRLALQVDLTVAGF